MATWRKLLGRIEPAPSVEAEAETAEDELADPRSRASPETLFRLLGDVGRPLTDGVDQFELRAEELGSVRVPFGRIMACDPLTFSDVAPVVDGLEGGPFAVTAVHRADADDDMVGYALLRLTDAPPTEWRDEGTYGVSTGTSCFADPAALQALRNRLDDYYDAQSGAVLSGEEPLVDAMTGRTAVMYEVQPGLQIAAFASGTGDGIYALWTGFDASGTPAALLTSFDNVADETRAS